MAKFVETLQTWFLHEALPTLFKELNSMKNSGCHGTWKIFFLQNLKKSSCKKRKERKIFSLDIWHETFLVDAYHWKWKFYKMYGLIPFIAIGIWFLIYCAIFSPSESHRLVWKLEQRITELLILPLGD
jgi:hypothetical protein